MHHFRQTLRVSLLSAALILLCAVAASAADLGVATVNSDGLRLRAKPDTESSILTMAPVGAHVIVKENLGNGWCKVDYDATEGYMSTQYLTLSTKIDADLGYGKVHSDGATLNLRSGPGTNYDRVAILNDGTVFSLQGFDNGWFKVRCSGGTEGYASSDYVVTCLNSSGDRADGSSASASLGQRVVACAKQFLGRPYVWGGNGPNVFDCSGFTKYVYAQFGYYLNRTASGQLSNGVKVSRDQLRPGDLIFFDNGQVSTPVSHVGIYIGGGNFIHASTNSYVVEINTLNGSYYSRIYAGARRIV